MTISVPANRTIALKSKQNGKFQSAGRAVENLTVTALGTGMAHGEAIRLIIPYSYSVGAKAQAAPRHWEMGDDVFINGSPVTQAPVGGAVSSDIWTGFITGDASYGTKIVNDALRHARVSQQYRAIANGTCTWSKGFGGSVDPYPFTPIQKFVCRYYVKPGSDYFRSKLYPTDSITGTFQTGPNRTKAEGETVDVVSATVTTTAVITHVTAGGAITLDYGAAVPNTDDLAGGTVTGQVSGAVANFPAGMVLADTASPWSTKHMRVWPKNANSTGPSTVMTISSVNNGQVILYGYDDLDVQTVYSENGVGYIASNPGVWHSIDLVIDLTGPAGFAQVRLDDVVVFENSTFTPEPDPATDLRLASLGMDLPGVGSFAEGDVGFGADFGEIYADSDTRVLWVCDSPTWAGSTVKEPQRPTAWTEDGAGAVTIDAVLNQGALADLTTSYIAMTDGGSVVFEGVSLAGESGGTAALAWLAPNGLAEDNDLVVTTDGTYDFGAVGPDLVMLMESHRLPAGQIDVTDIKFGPNNISAQWQNVGDFFTVEDSVAGAPNSKGVRMGGTGTGLNPTTIEGRLEVQYTPSTRGFEARTLYWPQANQDAATPYLARQVSPYETTIMTWQCKSLWNMANFDFGAGDTDFFPNPDMSVYDTQAKIDAGDPPQFTGGTAISSNSIGTEYVSHGLRDLTDTHFRIFPEPILLEFGYDQGAADGSADGTVTTLTGTTVQGVLGNNTLNNIVMSEINGPVKVVDSFTYPGFMRGFNIDAGANFYDLEYYKASGPGAYCRVAICDNADYFLASKRVILEVQSWSSTSITLRQRQTWFDLGNLTGKWLCVIDSNNTQIASVQF